MKKESKKKNKNGAIIQEETNDQRLKQLLIKKDIDVFIPLISGCEKVGYFVLGKKKSGNIYSTNDISVLETIAPQIAVAIQNIARAEEKLKQEKMISENKSKFLAIAGHRLRTPLSASRWNTEMLLSEEYGKLNKQNKELVTQISQNTLRMIDLVNDLFEIRNIERGDVLKKLKIRKLNPVNYIKNSINKLEKSIEQKYLNVKITNKITGTIAVLVNKVKFQKAIDEIISNAVLYNKDKGNITITLRSNKNNFVLSVSDTGFGINEKELGLVFAKFYRGEQALLANTENSGIGLYLAKSYISSWGGDITIQSKKNKGTKVKVIIPLA